MRGQSPQHLGACEAPITDTAGGSGSLLCFSVPFGILEFADWPVPLVFGSNALSLFSSLRLSLVLFRQCHPGAGIVFSEPDESHICHAVFLSLR